MLIRSYHLTDKGLRLIDVDGSHVDITAEDAIVLGMVIRRHEKKLREMMYYALESQERKAKESKEA